MGCCPAITKCCRLRKLKKATKIHPELSRALSIKEVFNLFLIIDYLPMRDLIRLGRASRGFYWLSGHVYIIEKFQISLNPTS